MKRERCRERFRKFSQKIVVIIFIVVKNDGGTSHDKRLCKNLEHIYINRIKSHAGYARCE